MQWGTLFKGGHYLRKYAIHFDYYFWDRSPIRTTVFNNSSISKLMPSFLRSKYFKLGKLFNKYESQLYVIYLSTHCGLEKYILHTYFVWKSNSVILFFRCGFDEKLECEPLACEPQPMMQKMLAIRRRWK